LQQAHSPQQILKARVGTQRVEAQNHRPHIATISAYFSQIKYDASSALQKPSVALHSLDARRF